MNNKLIVRFNKNDIIWVSDTLFTTKKEYISYPFCFENYHDKIKTFFKRPEHFEHKGRYILTEIFNNNVGKIIWDGTTGYINLQANNHFISSYIAYKDPDLQESQRCNEQDNYFIGIQSKATLEKHLKILELIGVLEVLYTTQKTKLIKLYLDKCNELLKVGTEKQIKFFKNYNLGEYKYGCM